MTHTATPVSDDTLGQDLHDCPYKGLRPYTEADGEYFFGREVERDLIIANLMASRLTVLCGPSGVGKSSLLQAGVLRELRNASDGGYDFMAADRIIAVYFSEWRDDPLVDLGLALAKAIPSGYERDELLAARAPLSLELLNEVTRRLDADIYLILDQFEEEAIYQVGQKGEIFAAELGRIISAPGRRVSVLIGVREDGLAKLDRFAQHVSGVFDNYLRLQHLTDSAAHEAIESPVVHYNSLVPDHLQVAIEDGLIGQLLGELRTGRVAVVDAGQGGLDVAVRTIETPFLQLVMTRLWMEETEIRGSRLLRRSTLRELGGAEQIVRTHLDRVMDDLAPGQRAMAARVFRHLVTPSGTKFAHTASDLADFGNIADLTELVQVLERLAAGKERVLRTVAAPVDRPGPPRYEIFHDVMAPAVLDWRSRYIAEQDRLAAQRDLEDAQRAAEARALQARRRRRRKHLIFGSVATTLIVVVAIVAVGFQQYWQNTEDRKSAEVAAGLALASQQLPIDPAQSLQGALAAFDQQDSPQTRAAISLALDRDTNRLAINTQQGRIQAGTYSPDGTQFLTAGADGTAKIFNVRSGQPGPVLTTAEAEGVALSSASFSVDGQLVATVNVDGGIFFYRAATGESIGSVFTDQRSKYAFVSWGVQDDRQIVIASNHVSQAELWDPSTMTRIARVGEPGNIYAARLSPDGSRIAGILLFPALRAAVWDARTGAQLAETEMSFYDVRRPSFATSDGHRLVFLGQEQSADYWRVVLWDWATGGASTLATSPNFRFPGDLTVSRDGGRVAVTGDKSAVVMDAATGDVTRWVPEQPDFVNSVDLSPDARWVVTGGNDGRARVWQADGDSLFPVAELLGHRGNVTDVEFDPQDPYHLSSVGGDGRLRTWDIPSSTQLNDGSSWILDAAISRDGEHIVTAEDTGSARVYNADGSRLEVASEPVGFGNEFLYGVSFTQDGKSIVALTANSQAPSLWKWQDSAVPERLAAMPDTSYLTAGFALSGDGQEITAGTDQNQVVTWSLDTKQIVATRGTSSGADTINSISEVPGTDLIAAASSDGTVRMWDSRADEPVLTIGQPGDVYIRAIAVSVDGALLATVTEDHVVRIFRTGDGGLERMFDGPPTVVSDATFSPDGRLLALSAADAGVHVWQWQESLKVAEIRQHANYINSVVFAPDGLSILTSSDDRTAALGACLACKPFENVLDAARERQAQRTP